MISSPLSMEKGGWRAYGCVTLFFCEYVNLSPMILAAQNFTCTYILSATVYSDSYCNIVRSKLGHTRTGRLILSSWAAHFLAK